MDSRHRVPVHVECVLRTDIDENEVERMVMKFPELKDHITSLAVCDLGAQVSVSYWQAQVLLHIYRLIDSVAQKDYLDGAEALPACEQWVLPCEALSSTLWESVIVSEDIKYQLLGYGLSTSLFADYAVNTNVIPWNRMILLHGPPGTGKTTLCKSLAQKLFIRSERGRFHSGILLEVNSHSLFSKWFSESGKLVIQLFEHIEELVEDTGCFVAVLIDEVESLAASRVGGLGADPGDAVRSVNAVLTSLDSLRHRRNVIILCTSNIMSGIDEAFIDRLDLCIKIGLPSFEARYRILCSCVEELIETGIVSIAPDVDFSFDMIGAATTEVEESDRSACNTLMEIAQLAENLSGRMLRKIPLKAHALYLQKAPVSMLDFLDALQKAVNREVKARDER